MWLLNVRSRKLERFNEKDVSYAILSHTWAEDEVTFQDMMSDPKAAQTKNGYRKIDLTCKQALKDKLGYCWMDTCCIDKSSSTELSEAINSMYRWYERSSICYAYLSDIPPDCPCLDDYPTSQFDVSDNSSWATKLSKSRWFYRGWTLQELIAPYRVQFYGSGWNYVGSKIQGPTQAQPQYNRSYLLPLLSLITTIDQAVLEDTFELRHSISIAKKMSWAANRSTTRVEDGAYSLMGIFQVNMPLLYGEGMKAFIRLQEEIVKNTNDLSVLAWSPAHTNSKELFASSLSGFQDAGKLVSCREVPGQISVELTNRGIRVRALVLRDADLGPYAWIILNCRYDDNLSGPVAIKVIFHDRNLRGKEIDPNLSYEVSFFSLYETRLRVIAQEDCQKAQMQSLVITKNPKDRFPIYPQLLPRFWVRVASGISISRTDSEKNWNCETGVMCPEWMRPGDEISSNITLQQTHSGEEFIIKFTFSTRHGSWDLRSGRPQEGFHFHVLCYQAQTIKDMAHMHLMPPVFSPYAYAKLTLYSSSIMIAVKKENIMGTFTLIIDVSIDASPGAKVSNNWEEFASLALCTEPEHDDMLVQLSEIRAS